MSEQIEVTIRLPNEMIAAMKQVADLAGVPVETVTSVILALFVIKEQGK